MPGPAFLDAQPVVQLGEIHKRYGEVEALAGVDLDYPTPLLTERGVVHADESPSAIRARVLRALYARRVAITDVDVAGADLEQAVLQITGRT